MKFDDKGEPCYISSDSNTIQKDDHIRLRIIGVRLNATGIVLFFL